MYQFNMSLYGPTSIANSLPIERMFLLNTNEYTVVKVHAGSGTLLNQKQKLFKLVDIRLMAWGELESKAM